MRLVITLLLAFTVASTVAQPVIKKVSITDLEQTIAKSDHPLIVNFWATWCTPCIKEIPYFQTTAAQYKEVELILVSLDFRNYYPSKIADFAQTHGFTSPIVWLEDAPVDFHSRIDPHWTGGIPSSLFINNATHYRRFFDRQLTEPQVGLEIKEMLRQP